MNYDDPSTAPVERTTESEILLKSLLQEGKKLEININLTNL